MKVKIGNDDFCIYCMDWREFNEEGRCKVCNHIIHRENKKQEKNRYENYKIETPSYEPEDDIE